MSDHTASVQGRTAPLRLSLACVVLAGLTLTACSPRQICINGATRDLRVLNGLIAETEGNLQRGYGLRDETRTDTRWVLCDPGAPATPTSPARPPRRCLEDFDYTVTRPAAIDLGVEAQKLTSMRAKQRQLSRAAGPAIEACKRANPK